MFPTKRWLATVCLAIITTQSTAWAAPASRKPTKADADYTLAPAPAWIKSPGADKPAAQTALPAGAKARRNVLTDIQVQLSASKQTQYQRIQRTALDTSTLREVSEPTIEFNPAYQKLIIHSVAIHRDGQRSDRLKDLRIEVMRREQMLERQMLDGMRTALLMLRDVRVGDVVDVAYSIEGANPIFEGRYSEVFAVADDAPTDRLHIRIEAPTGRSFQIRGVPTESPVERFEEGGKQVVRIVRQNIAAIEPESAVPPWFKVYPAVQITEYRNWKEVDQWAQTLFPSEPPSGELAQRIATWKAKALPPEALLAEVLQFVQDDVRYFSVSLGESSHRPKPASRTLADRMGDCKDKVLLLNTLLKGLGFDAKPTLVSTFRNRGVANYLPSHDQFDHVISVVELQGERYYLDPTVQGQGLGLRNRGYFPYGVGLVVGDGETLRRISAPSFAEEGLSYRQEWDLSDMKRPAQLSVQMITRGLTAERWRAAIASNGLDRLNQSMSGTYVRIFPGLQPAGPPLLEDSRDTNQLKLTLRFEHPNIGEYKRGGLELELSNVEIADSLMVPTEARRLSPYMLDQPRAVDTKVVVRTPRAFVTPPPAPTQIADKHFLFTSRMEIKGNEVTVSSRYERRADEVLPNDLEAFREKILRARQSTGQRLRVLLIDRDRLEPIAREVDRRVARFAGSRPDALLRLMQDQEFDRQLADDLLPQLAPASPLALKVRSERAILHNQLGEFDRGLLDAQTVLAAQPTHPAALEARGVALMGLNRSADAGKDFEQLLQIGGQQGQAVWLAISQYMQGQYSKAESTLQQQLGNTAGDERAFALIWMNLAAERQQAGKGRATVAGELATVDDQTWPGAMLHYLAGKLSRDALLRLAAKDAEQERLRMAEASFVIGQQLIAQGQTGEARQWFERAVGTQALPYREVALARIELMRLGGTR